MTVSLILDIVTVLVAVLFVLVGYHRGFIKSVVRLIGFAASVVAAALLSNPVAVKVYDMLFRARVETLVTQKVEEAAASATASLQEQIASVVASLPQSIQSLIAVYGVDVESFVGAAQPAQTLSTTILDQIVTPLCTTVLQLIVFLVLFLVLFLIIHLVGKLLDKIFASLPIIKQVNGALGAVIGFAEAVLVLFVLCYGVQLYMSLTGAQSVITSSDLEQTYLVRYLMELNPILG